MLIPRRSVRTSQPQQAVGIDRSNPICSGLAFAATPMTGDAVSGSKPVLSGSSSLGINKAGRSYKSPVSQIPGAWTYTVNIPSSFDITVFTVYRNITPQASSSAVPTLNFNSAESVFFSSTGSQSVFSSAGNASANLTTLIAGDVNTLAGVKKVNAQYQWLNGAQVTTDVTGNRAVGSINTVSIGRPAGGNNIENAEYLLVAYFNRALSYEELKSLSANPWQIFEDEEDYLFIPAAGGGSSVSLIIAEALHGHAADSLAFSMETYLAVAESLHAHAADNLTLTATGSANLAIQEATHAHVADGVALTTNWLLSVADALHGHAADSVSLTIQAYLAVAEALHGHTADNLTLDTSNATFLTVQEATHSHGADSIGLSLNTWLAIVDAAHAHTADVPTLSAEVALQIAESLHAQFADAIVLSFPGETTLTPDDIAAIASAVWEKIIGTRSAGDHLQLQSAVLLGNETGAGTTHITFTDGTAVVEADVPLPGEVGNRTNVTISV